MTEEPKHRFHTSRKHMDETKERREEAATKPPVHDFKIHTVRVQFLTEVCRSVPLKQEAYLHKYTQRHK